MSSETKSRAGLREAIEQVMKLYAAHGDGNPPEYGLPTLSKAWREVRAALESSSSADTGGRERLEEARLWRSILVTSSNFPERAMSEANARIAALESGADLGTTGAEGLRVRLICRFCGHEAIEGEFVSVIGCSKCNPTQTYSSASVALEAAATQRAPVTPPAPDTPQGGPFSESLKKPSRDCVWIVEQNGRVHSVHSTHESAMKEQGENLRIGVPWQVLPWAIPAPVTTPGRDEGSREVKLRRALRKYGVHQGRCEAFPGECTCGLEAALAAAKEPRG